MKKTLILFTLLFLTGFCYGQKINHEKKKVEKETSKESIKPEKATSKNSKKASKANRYPKQKDKNKVAEKKDPIKKED